MLYTEWLKSEWPKTTLTANDKLTLYQPLVR